MSNTKRQICAILSDEKCRARFEKRRREYSRISSFVPNEYEDIVCDNKPWFCHGLAFRMATYLEDWEVIFQRLNSLLELAESVEGWIQESKNIGNAWSYNYNEFFHFLWMLQCVEYYKACGERVVFAAVRGKKAPDLRIVRDNQSDLYVECYVYSKWWFLETFINDVISKIDRNLTLERKYNLKVDNRSKDIYTVLEEVMGATSDSAILKAKDIASKKSPYVMYENHGFELLMKGDGKYQPDPNNAHGDPSFSASAFINEIVQNKRTKNDLENHRPNLLMVNSLSFDYQMVFISNRVKKIEYEDDVIDRLMLCSCGIDRELKASSIHVCANVKHNHASGVDIAPTEEKT